jgi:CheY-like chemotaxis protein
MVKIMVVDDEADIIYMVKEILKREGHEVRGATSGQEALTKLKDDKPDLILLDIMMPDLDGWKTLELIKKEEVLKNVPVSMLTAKPLTVETAGRKEIEGLVDYIEKPFSKESLLKKVNYNIIEDLEAIKEKKDKLREVVDEKAVYKYEIAARVERLHKSILATLKKSIERIEEPLEASAILESINEQERAIEKFKNNREKIEKKLMEK